MEHYDLTAEGVYLVVNLNSRAMVDGRDGKYSRGTIALQSLTGAGTVRFCNVKLRPLGLKSLFACRDLTGWTVIPGCKSTGSGGAGRLLASRSRRPRPATPARRRSRSRTSAKDRTDGTAPA